ncbi:hypothetical protein [Curtobacterium sp. MCBD17_013]|uniref:hypothetical protein n=1 Tax=Curtobacterium sp. MCBD17_013 TaxID=2175668 RepID=UPI0011B46BD8|nr:hypothetical protein [Curtobacterium sp. MCBD17_013]
MGMRTRSRVLLIVSVVLVVLALVGGAVVGVKAWYAHDQREKTAAAFAAMPVVDRRIDIQSVIPGAKRRESGVAVRLEGPGPVVSYSFKVSATPDWKACIDQAMERAGYGRVGDPWTIQVRDLVVTVTTSDPSAGNGGTAFLLMSV